MQCSGGTRASAFSVRDSFQPEADASIRESPSHVSAAASPYEPRPPSGGQLAAPPATKVSSADMQEHRVGASNRGHWRNAGHAR